MHRIVEHPCHRARITSIGGLDEGIGHIGAIHIVEDEHLRILGRCKRAGSGASQHLLLIERVLGFDKLQSDFAHDDLPVRRSGIPVRLDDLAILPTVDGALRRIGVDVEESEVEFAARLLEPWHFGRCPDGKVRADECNLPKHPVSLQTIVETQGDVVPEVVVALGGRPEAVRLVDHVVVLDAGEASVLDEPCDKVGSQFNLPSVEFGNPGIGEPPSPIAEHHSHAMALTIFEDVLHLVQVALGEELAVANEACCVVHHTHQLRTHEVQPSIDLLPFLFADLQSHASVVQLIRIPLCPIADIAVIYYLPAEGHPGDISFGLCRQGRIAPDVQGNDDRKQ